MFFALLKKKGSGIRNTCLSWDLKTRKQPIVFSIGGEDLMESSRKTVYGIMIHTALICCLCLTGPCLTDAATFHIRTDGGTSLQCTGMADAPYPGAGAAQACAWSHPFWALDAEGKWHIKGGDTLMIHSGSYRMGVGAPNTGWCEAAWSYECHLPPLPSGPDPQHTTRILGSSWDMGCVDPPQLWGTERAWQIISLDGTNHAVVSCLELTDHSGCVEGHSNTSVRCQRDTPPYGDWAAAGIHASDSSHVTLSHLNIHGMADRGIYAGRISQWTIEDVRIAGNGWAGWDGDIFGDDANSGTLHFKNWLVEWNGCAESYPDGEPNNCWAQTAGGYGDGVGTGATGGDWIIEDSTFRYNTSDGLDLLYARLDTHIDIKRIRAYGNAGNQIKVNGPTAIENALLVGNCGYFQGKDLTYQVDHCRGAGAAVSLNMRRGNRVSLINSTIAGEGDCLGTIECSDPAGCDGSETVIILNNIFMGYKEFLSPTDTSCYLWFDQNNFYNTRIDYNVVFGAKIGAFGLAANDISRDPLLMNADLATFDGHLQSNSPALESGLPAGGLNGLVPAEDLEETLRPQGSAVDRGAYEKRSERSGPIIIDHTCTDISQIPDYWIDQAKQLTLHYAHTSHGGQIWQGSNNLESLNSTYGFARRESGSEGLPPVEVPPALRMYDGNPPHTYITPELYWDSNAGKDSTRSVADTGDYDFSMWAWCGQVSDASQVYIERYLAAMNQFETEYPGMGFIYMTGHLDGGGPSGNLNIRNEQIRTYCRANNKILFDFADIERYNPDGDDFLDAGANDECYYNDWGNNWADEWCAENPGSALCDTCEDGCNHSRNLNCNLKARAFWWMMARLAGWNPSPTQCPEFPGPSPVIRDVDFPAGSDCTYRDDTAITIGPNINILSNATLILEAPRIVTRSPFHAATGATVRYVAK